MAGELKAIRDARGRYLVTKPWSGKNFALLWLSIFGVFALVLLIAGLLKIRGAALLVAGLPVPVWWYRENRVAMTIDRNGARLGRVGVPWDRVAQVMVWRGSTPDEIQAGLRLRQGAPLPPGVEPSAAHRGDPNAPQVIGSVPASKFDMDRLVRTVRNFAPQVQVVDGLTGRQGPAANPYGVS